MSRLRRLTRPTAGRPHGSAGERGQILVLFTIVLVAILGFTALVVDLGMLRNDRQTLANAVDAGALAGGTLMPVDGAQAGAVSEVTALIRQTVSATDPSLSNSDYTISYRCLVGTGAGSAGAFDSADIDAFVPTDCDPSRALGHSPPILTDFTGAGKTRSTPCRPDLGDKCNVVIVEGAVTTDYTFARVVGVESGNTGVVQSAACRGYCGVLPDTPFDVVMVLDDSGSMGANSSAGQTRTYWAKRAANELLDSLETARGTQRVGAVKYSGTWSAPTAAVTLSPLTTDFDAVRAAIAPLTGNGGNTPLKQGMALGAAELAAGARSGVEHVLVFVSDGRANPDTTITARPTSAEVAAFGSGADQVYSVAIGAGGTGANNPDLPLMQSLAKPDDGTHFFHVVDASDLPDVFQQIAVELLKPKSHLIKVYPAPIVTAVSGGSTVSISGKYFTGATTVTFGGVDAAFTVHSDTSITATTPSGASGQTVHVRVTTQGGSSPAAAADRYQYP
jgi:hypothetical protein